MEKEIEQTLVRPGSINDGHAKSAAHAHANIEEEANIEIRILRKN